MKARAFIVLLAAVAIGAFSAPSSAAGGPERSVVYLQLPSPVQGIGSGSSGTGFIVASDSTASYIVTSAHVLDCDTYGLSCHQQISVRVPSNFAQAVTADLMYAGASNATDDYAIIRVAIPHLPSAKFG